MPGNIQIQTQIGCDADEVLMTLSGTAEPDGGDHYATVDFTGQSQNIILANLVSVELETSPGVWVGVTIQSFLFTSAGETYTLRARGHEVLMNWANIKFPYTVVAVYAPAWAALDGIINGTPTDECCIPTGETSTEQNIWSGAIPGAGGYSTYDSACGVRPTAPWTFFSACLASSSTYTTGITPSITIYDWVAKSFTLSHTFVFTHSFNGVNSTLTITMTFTKTTGNAVMTYTHNTSGVASGTIADAGLLPTTDSTVPAEVLLDIPCSLYKIRIAIASERLAQVFVGGSAFIASDTGLIGVEFYRA